MEVLDHVDADAIRALRERGEFFWLDVRDPRPEDLTLAGELLGIPPLALEDSLERGQRPKIDRYDDQALVVFYGAHDDEVREVHIHISGAHAVTVRCDDCAALLELRERARTLGSADEAKLVHRILDVLTDSFADLVSRRSDTVDRLEDGAFGRPSDEERKRIATLRRELFRLHQIAVPQRDMLAGGAAILEALPGLRSESMAHPFRDVHDHLALVTDQIAYAREVLSQALDVFLATTSNRLNEVAARLTLVATIVLPLTVVTGFFGQNFGWMVRHVDSLWAFLVFGVGGIVVPVVIALVVFARAGWLRAPR